MSLNIPLFLLSCSWCKSWSNDKHRREGQSCKLLTVHTSCFSCLIKTPLSHAKNHDETQTTRGSLFSPHGLRIHCPSSSWSLFSSMIEKGDGGWWDGSSEFTIYSVHKINKSQRPEPDLHDDDGASCLFDLNICQLLMIIVIIERIMLLLFLSFYSLVLPVLDVDYTDGGWRYSSMRKDFELLLSANYDLESHHYPSHYHKFWRWCRWPGSHCGSDRSPSFPGGDICWRGKTWSWCGRWGQEWVTQLLYY